MGEAAHYSARQLQYKLHAACVTCARLLFATEHAWWSWTSGRIGLRRINAEAEALMQKAEEEIEKNGNKVKERKDI